MTDTTDRSSAASLTIRLQAYGGSLALVAVATLVGLWVAPRWGTSPVDMIYMPGVLAAAALWGIGPALVAGVCSALSYNFFFTSPVHTFRMDRAADIVTVSVLLIVGLVTSKLASDIRRQAQLASAHASRNSTIAGFARKLLSTSSEEDIADAAAGELNRLFACNVVIVRDLPAPRVITMVPSDNQLTPSDVAAAAATLEDGIPAGRGTHRAQPSEWVFHAIRSKGSIIAAAGLARDDGAPAVVDDQMPLFDSLLDQVALAFERARLERQSREFATVREHDRVRSALMSALGQEVTPSLTAIGEGVKELRRAGVADKRPLTAIAASTLKIERYIANLVDLGPVDDQKPVEARGISIDLFQRAVFRDGRSVRLTPKEFALLAEMAKHPGRVLTHQHLLRAAWGPAQESQTEYLRVAIRSLRQKLEHDPANPEVIVNEPAVGYRLVAETIR